MSTIVTRAGKGSPLTHNEVDANFNNLNNDKYQSGSSPSFAGTTLSSGNLTFSSTGQRITGDMLNATIANRLAFQNSTANANTSVTALPNGTGGNANFSAYNASDPSNSSRAQIAANGTTDVRISSDIIGTGTYLPMTFYTGGSERMRLDTSGNLGLATATVSTNFRQEIVGAAGSNTGPASSGTMQNASAVMRIRPGGGFTATLDIGQGGATGSWLQSTDTSNLATTYPLLLNPVGGNVGIGTASPSTWGKFAVVGSGNAGVANFIGNASITGANPTYTGSIRLIDNPTSSTTASGGIEFLTSAFGSGYGWKIASIDSSGVQMTFATRQNSASWTEVMRLDSSGNVGIGGTASAFDKVTITGTLPSSSLISVSCAARGIIPSSSTSQGYGFGSQVSTQAASFTLGSLRHFYATQGTIGAGSSVTNQIGFFAEDTLTGATNNFGFYSNIASGSNRWNFYAAGTADNYFAGNVYIATTSAQNNSRLRVVGSSTSGLNYTLLVEGSGGADNFYVRDDGEMYSLPTYNRTSASASNVGVDAAGGFFRSTSSLRYKTNVVDAAHGLADVLKLRSVTYKGKNDGDTVFGGLIAEEVHDAGLTEFVAYDKEGRPDALHYGNMVALLVKAIQELSAKVAALEAK